MLLGRRGVGWSWFWTPCCDTFVVSIAVCLNFCLRSGFCLDGQRTQSGFSDDYAGVWTDSISVPKSETVASAYLPWVIICWWRHPRTFISPSFSGSFDFCSSLVASVISPTRIAYMLVGTVLKMIGSLKGSWILLFEVGLGRWASRRWQPLSTASNSYFVFHIMKSTFYNLGYQQAQASPLLPRFDSSQHTSDF